MSMMGDAISHAVLPGLAAAFIVSGERQGFLIFLGAAIVGVLTVFLTKSRATFGKVDEGAAIGVVFTFLFALGLIMIVQVADRVDLDPGCVLYGSLETVVLQRSSFRGLPVPPAVVNLTVVTLSTCFSSCCSIDH